MSTEEHEIDRQLKKPDSPGGASVTMEDRRVTRAIDFLQPIITGGVLAGIIYFANQVGTLRDAVVETNRQLALSIQQGTNLTEDMRDHEVRIRSLEGRNSRGEAEQIILPSEKRRGH